MRNDIRVEVEARYSTLFDAFIGDIHVGSCMTTHQWNKEVWAWSLGVRPEYRNQGVATALIQRVIETHPDVPIYLYVGRMGDGGLTNDQLQAWYARLGWEVMDVLYMGQYTQMVRYSTEQKGTLVNI